MENLETKIATAFCDLQPLELARNHHSAIMDNVVYSEPGTISELWLVFVAGNIQRYQSHFQELARKHELTGTFDRIFSFRLLSIGNTTN